MQTLFDIGNNVPPLSAISMTEFSIPPFDFTTSVTSTPVLGSTAEEERDAEERRVEAGGYDGLTLDSGSGEWDSLEGTLQGGMMGVV
jgi:hypothetical protein